MPPCQSIVLGHETALQICRAIGPRALARLPHGPQALPDRVPPRAVLDQAEERLRRAYPQLRLTFPLHTLIGSTSRPRSSNRYRHHSCTKRLPAGSVRKVIEGVYTVTPPLAFIETATRLTFVQLLELGCELCGTYRTGSGQPTEYDVAPLTSVSAIRGYAQRHPSLSGAGKAMRPLRYVVDGSASPRETKLALVLGLPSTYGGAGLGMPRMNYEVEASAAARAISGRRSLRCDVCWPERHVDVEYQSREHHEGELSRIRDSRRTNALLSMGYTVFLVTNDELDSLAATEVIAQAVRRRLGKRSRTKLTDLHARKLKLRRQLGLPVGFD